MAPSVTFDAFPPLAATVAVTKIYGEFLIMRKMALLSQPPGGTIRATPSPPLTELLAGLSAIHNHGDGHKQAIFAH